MMPVAGSALALVLGFALTAALTPVAMALAWRLGWVAHPKEESWHSRPTALMGGMAIFVGTSAAWLLSGDLRTLWPVAVPSAIMFLLGFVDDRVELSARVKLVGQFVAALLMVAAGVHLRGLYAWIAIPITVVWIVGVTNAVNFVDNMDGLAAGSTAISALCLGLYCLAVGSGPTAVLSFALAGACLGFLIYNANPARVFMGDCGSMFIGLALGALALQGTQQHTPSRVLALLLPMAILAFPIFDIALVSIVRPLRGRSILQRGWESSSYRLVALGLSQRTAVAVLWGVTTVFGALALLATWWSPLGVVLLGILLFTFLIVLGVFVSIRDEHAEESFIPAAVHRVCGPLVYKRHLLQVLFDVLLVPIAYAGAHLLRFEGAISRQTAEALVATLPLVLAAKLAGLHLCRAYSGLWRYAGISDAMRAVAGSAVGSVLAGLLVALATGFRHLSHTAFVVDWLAFTLLAVSTRMAYVSLRFLFSMIPPQSAPRVVIAGAGAEGLLAAQRLRDLGAPVRALVVGFVDDDPGKQGRMLDGVPVLGPLSALPSLIESGSATCCLLGVPADSPSGEQIAAFCRRHGIALQREIGALPPAKEPVAAARA